MQSFSIKGHFADVEGQKQAVRRRQQNQQVASVEPLRSCGLTPFIFNARHRSSRGNDPSFGSTRFHGVLLRPKVEKEQRARVSVAALTQD